jgi:thioredoxin-related protein
MTFEQLDDSLQMHPKKIFINFYADWCVYCHQMDKIAFQNPDVAAILNNNYYAVRMNVETADTVFFGNQVFINERINKRNPVHQIALLMASRKGKPFSLPAMVFLNENFEATARYFQYLNTEQMIEILKNPTGQDD